MVCRQRDNEIQAFAPQRADESLTECIGLGTLGRRFEDPESKVLYAAVKWRREDAIAIMEEKAIGMIRWDGFAQLLQGPGGGGMRGHIDVQNPACGMFYEHNHVEQAKGGSDHHTEVTRDDGLGMIAHKGLPALRRRTFPPPRVQAFRQILADGAW